MRELKKGLVKIYGDQLKAVYLFGSSARPASIPPRDLDLAVCARPPLTLPELLQLQGRLQEAAHAARALSLRPRLEDRLGPSA